MVSFFPAEVICFKGFVPFLEVTKMTRALSFFGFAACIAAVSLIMAPSSSYGKTAKACEEEWKANKATIKSSGKKKKDFIAECRADTAEASPASPAQAAPKPEPAAHDDTAAASPASPDSTGTASAPAQPKPKRASTPAKRAATANAKAGQFTSEADAKAHCPGATVVWANTRSNIYHYAGTSDYGKTKRGAYMCETETAAAGIRAAKDEKHP